MCATQETANRRRQYREPSSGTRSRRPFCVSATIPVASEAGLAGPPDAPIGEVCFGDGHTDRSARSVRPLQALRQRGRRPVGSVGSDDTELVAGWILEY